MPTDKKPRGGAWLGFIKLFSKLGPVVIKAGKAIKVGKVALAGASLLSYTLLFSWQFAIVILLSLVIHEYGHLWTMKQFSMKTRGMYIIPFVGAAAVPEEDFPNRKVEAVTALAGPLTGALMAVGIGVGYLVTNNAYCAAIASWVALINLFNLLPISPLDGGRVVKSVALSINTKLGLGFMVVALLGAAFLAFWQSIIIFAILIPLGLYDFVIERRNHKKHEAAQKSLQEATGLVNPLPEDKPGMSAAHTGYVAAGYAALAVFLWLFVVLMAQEPGASSALHVLEG